MSENYTTTFAVEQSPDAVFAAINDVPAWWNAIQGTTDQVGGEFRYEVPDLHRARIRVTDLVPAELVAWLVVENWFSFTRDSSEWTGTQIRFEISREAGQTRLRFEHIGLVAEEECFEICRSAWTGYINGSLRSLIETGVGRPAANEAGRARAEEQRLLNFVG